MAKKTILRRIPRNPGTVNDLAAQLVAKDINLSGVGYSIAWLVHEGMSIQEWEKLYDAVSHDWRHGRREANKINKKISDISDELSKLMDDYDDSVLREICAREDANFALGWAAAVRLLGK